MRSPAAALLLPTLFLAGCACTCPSTPPRSADHEFQALFPNDAALARWSVRHWSDTAKPPPEGARWRLADGVLHGSTPRGTWLVSDQTFGDFVLEFDFRLGEQGNSGVGLRFPDAGDPAFDGLEMQMVDERYYGAGNFTPDQLTGALYQAAAPIAQVYSPGEWNTCRITCQGPRVQIVMNGRTIQDLDLDTQTAPLQRGSPLKDRPRRGHIGFQELSRADGHVEIRGARIMRLDH